MILNWVGYFYLYFSAKRHAFTFIKLNFKNCQQYINKQLSSWDKCQTKNKFWIGFSALKGHLQYPSFVLNFGAKVWWKCFGWLWVVLVDFGRLRMVVGKLWLVLAGFEWFLFTECFITSTYACSILLCKYFNFLPLSICLRAFKA